MTFFPAGQPLTKAQAIAIRAGLSHPAAPAGTVAPNRPVVHMGLAPQQRPPAPAPLVTPTATKGTVTVPIASIMNLLVELLAAAPGIESTVEEAVTALHAQTGSVAKVEAIAGAGQQLLSVASAIAAANAPAPAVTNPTPAPVGVTGAAHS